MKTTETNECLSKRRNDSQEGLEAKHGSGELVEDCGRKNADYTEQLRKDAGPMKTQKRNEQGPRSELDDRNYQI